MSSLHRVANRIGRNPRAAEAASQRQDTTTAAARHRHELAEAELPKLLETSSAHVIDVTVLRREQEPSAPG